MSALPKPVLRGHIARRGARGIVGAIIFAGVNGALYYYTFAVPRQTKYEEFLKTYDAEAHEKELIKYGLLQSAQKVVGNN